MLLRTEAETYCEVIESVDSFTRADFVVAASDALLSVVTEAFRIPDQDPTDDSDTPGGITHDTWKVVFNRVAAKLGASNDYWTGEPSPDHPLDGVLYNLPLSDDLADIWRDLKTGLNQLAAGGSEADVLWEWKFGFETHWGRHASEALRALMQLRISERKK